jgi:hypothetical protein
MYWEKNNTAPSRIVDDAAPAVLPSLHLFNFFKKIMVCFQIIYFTKNPTFSKHLFCQ